jgi:hypothetical protein
MSHTIVVNIGPLTSFNSLLYHIGPQFQKIRDAYLRGESPEIIFDFKNLGFQKGMSIAAITALLSSAKKLKDFLSFPIPAIINWDPVLLGFLADIGFFEYCDKFQIFEWLPKNIIGGYKSGKTNPNTKILYYADIHKIRSDEDLLRIGEIKAGLKQKISSNFLMRTSRLFEGFDNTLEEIIGNTSLELIVNSLVHGEDTAWVGIQRSSKRITISICDSGIGFQKSLRRSYKNQNNLGNLNYEDSLFTGCLVQKNEHGLRLAISEVLNMEYSDLSANNEGWVIISSFNTEIRWQKNNWKSALNYFDNHTGIPKIVEGLGSKLDNFIEREQIENGYWKKFDNYLLGTRITFEIVIK